MTGLMLVAALAGAIPARRAAGQESASALSKIRPFLGVGATRQGNPEGLRHLGVVLSGGVGSAADRGAGWEASIRAVHVVALSGDGVEEPALDLVAGVVDSRWSATITSYSGIDLRAGVGFYRRWRPGYLRSNTVGANVGATWMFGRILGLDAQAHLLSAALGGTRWLVPLQVRLVM